MSTATRTERAAARRDAADWFHAPDRAATYDAFQAAYLARPRTLFLEIALHQVQGPVRRVLDVGCGPGDALSYLADRLPDATIVGIDPEAEMLSRAAERTGARCTLHRTTLNDLDAEPGSFDLILSYSNFRFWDEPAAALRKLSRLLRPGGLGYVQDLHRDLDDDLRAELVAQMEGAELQAFMASQLDSGYGIADVRRILDEAAVPGATLGIGGFAGMPVRSREAFAIIQRNDRIAHVLFQVASGGFRNPRGTESVFHLFIRGRGQGEP